MAFSSTTKNIPPPLIKTNSSVTRNDTIGNCNLFPNDTSCIHSPTYNLTAKNATAVPKPPAVNNTKNMTKPANNTNTNNTSSIKAPVKVTAPPMNMTAMTNTTANATINTKTQAHQCPDGSYADANASCVA